MDENLVKLEAAVRKLAADNPTFVYTRCTTDDHMASCLYRPTEHNPQGCIIGAALQTLGKPVRQSLEGDGATAVIGAMLGIGVGVHGETVVSPWYNYVQRGQDDGMTWAAAVVYADTQMAVVSNFKAQS